MAAILRDEPRPLPEIKASIPASLAGLVTRCLRKDPAQRFQTMLEVKQALAEAALAATTSSSVVTAPVATSSAETSTVASQEGGASIAVLPFVNLSGDKENEYFSDGLAEEILNALTKVPELNVVVDPDKLAPPLRSAWPRSSRTASTSEPTTGCCGSRAPGGSLWSPKATAPAHPAPTSGTTSKPTPRT